MKKKEIKEKDLRIHADEKGTPFYEENRVELSSLPKKSWVKHVYKAIDLFKSGLSRQVIADLIAEETKLPQSSVLEQIVTKASNIISSEFFKDTESVLQLHLSRYNKDITTLLNKKYALPPLEAMIAKTNDYFEVLHTLEQKEKLLGFHRASFKLQLNQTNTKIVKKENYNLDKLSFKEQIELLNLLEKTRGSISTKSISQGVEQTNNIEEAEVVEEITNVEKIAQTQVIVNEEDRPKTLIDVQSKLQDALKKKAQEAYILANSKTAKDEL